MLDVLHEVFLSQCSDTFEMSTWHLILFRLAPEILESIMDGSELDFVDFEVIAQLFIVVLVRHLRRLKRKLVFLADALLYWLHLDTGEVLNQIINNFGSVTLNQFVHGSREVVHVEERFRLLLVVLPVIALLHRLQGEPALICLFHASIKICLANVARS